MLYALVALVPVVFYRGTSEVFEFPKSELLAAGALLLAFGSFEGEMARWRAQGFPSWARALPGRVATGARRDPLGGAIGLFLLSAFVSALVASRHDAALFGAHESEAGLKTALATSAVYFASRALARDPRHFPRLARAVAVGLIGALLYASIQMLGLDPFPWTRSATIEGVRRIPGTLGHANHLGTFIAMCLPVVACMASVSRSRRSKLLWLALGVASLPVLAATLSRGAWMAALAGLVVFGLVLARSRSRVRVNRLVLAAALLAAAFLVPLFTPLRSEMVTRFRQITDVRAPSTQSRVHLWRAGIEMARDHPLLGVGTDGYLAAFPRYRTPEYWTIEWNGVSAKAHDELIQVAATQGILGLLAALLVALFAARAVMTRPAGFETAAAAAALAAFAVSGLVGFTVVSTGTLAAALAGWAAGAEPRAPDPAAPRDRMTHGATWGLVAILAGIFVLLPWLAETAVVHGRGPDRFASAADFAPWDARYPTELGRALLVQAFAETDSTRRARDLSRARDAFDHAARRAPRDGEVQALLARTKVSQGLPLADVRAGFDRAISLEPQNANVLELAAQGYLEMNRTAEARTAALRCAALFPEYAMPMSDLGVAALLEGRVQDAADTLTLALRRNWHGEEAAAMAAKSNYVAALREMRVREVLPPLSEPTPTRSRPTR